MATLCWHNSWWACKSRWMSTGKPSLANIRCSSALANDDCGAKSRSHVEKRLEESKRWFKGVVIDEKQLLPTREEFNEFKDNMQQLRAKVERLQRQFGKGRANADSAFLQNHQNLTDLRAG